ncbi:MAG: hypothetical protein SCK57_05645 [Bacillota bacterium]|nr:hypothetical protein [Bacillota bacterium]MDW7677125.1 hypothetical protein [Bacillota bacterium]
MALIKIEFKPLGNFLKQNQRWIVFLLLILLMVLHVRDIYLVPPESAVPWTWLGYGLGGLIGLVVNRHKKEPLSRFLLYSTIVGMTMSANYLLYQTGVLAPSYVIFIAVVGVLLIVDILQTDHSHLLLKTGIVLLAVALFFASDYDQYQDRLLKDHRFDHYIRRTFDLQAPLSAEDLEHIEGFYLSRYTHVSRLDGIEHFTNLNRLTIWEASLIQDLTLVADLPLLETLMLGGAHLDAVNRIPPIPTLKTLELVYPDKGRLETLAQFPKLEELDLQGVHAPLHYESLRHLDLPDSIQVLGIADTLTFSLDEAADLPRLHHLRFYQVLLKDVEQLESMDELATIRLQRTQFENEALFHQLVQQQEIQLENLDLHEERIIEIP